MSNTTRMPSEFGRKAGFLALAIALTLLAASTGAVSVPGEWYQSLEKSFLNPPQWVFPVVWPILYILVAWAGYLCFLRSRSEPELASLWVLQIVLNGLWTPFFFAAKEPTWAATTLAFLVVTTLFLILRSWKHHRPIAWLLLPYFAWICFALYLNIEVIRLNPSVQPPSTARNSNTSSPSSIGILAGHLVSVVQ